jgi:hypothetical protein
LRELEQGEGPDDRVRVAGAGRKRLRDVDPELVPALLALVEPDRRGDPESPLRWTVKSTRVLAAELSRHGSLVVEGRFLLKKRWSMTNAVLAEATGLNKSRIGATLWDATPVLTALGHTASTGALTVTTVQQLAAIAGHDLASS